MKFENCFRKFWDVCYVPITILLVFLPLMSCVIFGVTYKENEKYVLKKDDYKNIGCKAFNFIVGLNPNTYSCLISSHSRTYTPYCNSVSFYYYIDITPQTVSWHTDSSNYNGVDLETAYVRANMTYFNEMIKITECWIDYENNRTSVLKPTMTLESYYIPHQLFISACVIFSVSVLTILSSAVYVITKRKCNKDYSLF